MTHATQPTRTRWMHLFFDGGPTWGSLDISGSRGGSKRYHLVVFPPGIARDERMSLRLWRAYPVWGLGSWVLMTAGLMAAVSPDVAALIATAVGLAAGAVAMAVAGNTRGGVRTLTATRMGGVDDAATRVALVELGSLAERLTAADSRLAAGDLTIAQHEAEVWRVYDRMPGRH